MGYFLFAAVIAGGWAAEGAGVRIGVYAEDISPRSLPISLAGSMADQTATKIHDRLHARCLMIESGGSRVALIVCDSCMIPRAIMDEAKVGIERETGLAAENVVISATHSHSCPTMDSVFQSKADPEYRALLIEGIIASAEQAQKSLQPAKLSWGAADCAGEVFNRRWKMKPGTIPPDPFDETRDQVQMNPPVASPNLIEPAGPIDPVVTFLAASSSAGPMAHWANYSLHYVGGIPAAAVSADYFGEFARMMAERNAKSEQGYVAAMTNGTSGDINNINFRKEAPAKEPFQQVRHVAKVVADVVQSADVHELKSPILKSARREIELGVRLPSPEDVERAKKILSDAGDRPLRTLSEIYAGETVGLATFPPTVKLWIQAVRIGDVGIVAIPCEVFVEIGLELKRTSPFKPTFIIELANGYNGYLPTPEHHALGGYETWRARSSYLEVDASRKIIQTAQELLRQIAKDD